MEASLQFISSQYDELLEREKQNSLEIESLKKKVDYLCNAMKIVNTERVETSCVFHKVPGINSEDFSATNFVTNLASGVGVPMQSSAISSTFVRDNKDKKSKTLVVKFNSISDKNLLMSKKSKLKEVKEFEHVVVQDKLSYENLQLFNYASKLRTIGFKYVYHVKNVIYAKKEEGSRGLIIRNFDVVDNLLLTASTNGSNVTLRRSGNMRAATDI